MSFAVGIDLGTTNTVVGTVRDGRALTLMADAGRRLIPSIVSFHPSGKVLVGDAAKDRRIVDPANTIYSVKRLIGRTWDSEEVQRARRTLPFELVEGPKHSVCVIARGEQYTLPEISAFVLRRAKAVAEQALGQSVEKAVITVPANFNDLQRGATKLAGKLAGLEVLRILNEPTAAALAYGHHARPAGGSAPPPGQGERLGVYDLGGGTFDITLLDLSGNVFEVLATGGDTSLGGDDIDHVIAEQIAQYILQNHRVDPRTDPSARATLRARAELLKMELSTRDSAQIELNDVVRGEGGAFIPISFTLTRAELEKLAHPLVERTLETCRFSIETIGLKVADVERVILVGGSTRMPIVVREVEEFFKRPATGRVNPDEVVALGAAIQAAALNRVSRKAAAAGAQRAGASPGAPSSTSQRAAAPVSGPQAPVGPLGPLPVVSAVPTIAAPVQPAPGSPPRPPPVPPPLPPRTAKPPVPPQRGVDIPPPPAWLGQTGAHEHDLPPPSAPPPHEVVDAPNLPKGGAVLTFELELPPPPLAPASARPHTTLTGMAPPAAMPPPLPRRAPPEQAPSAPPLPLSVQPGPLLSPLPFPPSQPPPVVREISGASFPPDNTLSGRVGENTLSGRGENTLSGRSMVPRPAPLLIDVTPISLGVETAGGYADVLIAANTPVPCDRTRIFRTASDGQTAVMVKVAQGESLVFAENTYLGDLELSGLKSAPRGEVKVAVTFEIDADGILNVRAKDVASGRETAARMLLQGTQSETSDVQEMIDRQTRHAVG